MAEMRSRINLAIPVIEIFPGEFYIDTKPSIISTILGSCVSVCFFAKNKRVGAMCHCVLPKGDTNSPKERFYFVNTAIKAILDGMSEKRGKKGGIQAMLFGGGNALIEDKYSVGTKNVAAAKETLKKNDIPIIAESTGGTAGRKVRFNTLAGEVLVRKIGSDRIRHFNYLTKTYEKYDMVMTGF